MNQLWIFVQDEGDGDPNTVEYRLYKNIKILGNQEFKGASSKFCFKNSCVDGDIDLIFIRQDMLFEFDVDTEEVRTIMKFPEPISPSIFEILPNTSQTKFMVNCFHDLMFIDTEASKVVNLAKEQDFMIDEFEDILWDETDMCWYVLINMLDEYLGFYLLQWFEKDMDKPKILLKFRNRLNIGDCSMSIN